MTQKRKTAPSEPKAAEPAIAFAVTEFLSELRLDHSERVMGAIALVLAASLEEAPAYAKAPLAGKLLDVVEKLSEVELDPKNLGLLEGIDP